jgi:hypothetical protein
MTKQTSSKAKGQYFGESANDEAWALKILSGKSPIVTRNPNCREILCYQKCVMDFQSYICSSGCSIGFSIGGGSPRCLCHVLGGISYWQSRMHRHQNQEPEPGIRTRKAIGIASAYILNLHTHLVRCAMTLRNTLQMIQTPYPCPFPCALKCHLCRSLLNCPSSLFGNPPTLSARFITSLPFSPSRSSCGKPHHSR